MTDYLGNEIKEGMTILTIRVKSQYGERGIIFNGIYTKDEIQPPSEMWDILQESYVQKRKGGRLWRCDSVEGQTYMSLLNDTSPFCFLDKGVIVAIKGVSDNQEQYFKFINKSK